MKTIAKDQDLNQLAAWQKRFGWEILNSIEAKIRNGRVTDDTHNKPDDSSVCWKWQSNGREEIYQLDVSNEPIVMISENFRIDVARGSADQPTVGSDSRLAFVFQAV